MTHRGTLFPGTCCPAVLGGGTQACCHRGMISQSTSYDLLKKVSQFSRSAVADSLQPHGLQHARLPCPSPTLSLLKLMSIESVMPSNHLILCRPLLPRLQTFPASGSFPMGQFFASGSQSIGVSASTSVLPVNTQN